MILASATIFLISGCFGGKPYVDVQSKEYATLEIVYTGDVSGSYIVYVQDLSKGCKEAVSLGRIDADNNTHTKTVKIPVEVPLWISANYIERFLTDSYTDTKIFLLTPEENKHYVVSYMRKDLSFLNTISDFDVYTLEGNKKVDVVPSRLHTFDAATECQ